MQRLKLLYAAVFLMQFGGSAGVTGLPLQAKVSFGTSFWGLAFIGIAGPLVYTVTCLLVGRAKGRVNRTVLVVSGTAIMAATFALACLAKNTGHLVLACAGQGIGAGLFWPMIEAAIVEGTAGRAVMKRVGVFNISWSLGDAIGTASAGFLFAVHPALPYVVLVVMMGGVLGCVAAARRLPIGVPNGWAAANGDRPADRQLNAGFRKAAWVGNFVGAGVVNVLRSVFTAPARDVFKMSAPAIGLVIGTFNATRTLTFFVLGRRQGWRYRRAAFLAVNSLIAIGMVSVVAASLLPQGLAIAVVFASFAAAGVGSGMTYFSSIFYTIDRKEAAEATAPMHEAVLGAGGAVAAAAAGLTNQMASSALSPLIMCAAAVAVGMAFSARYIKAGLSKPNILEDSPARDYPEQ